MEDEEVEVGVVVGEEGLKKIFIIISFVCVIFSFSFVVRHELDISHVCYYEARVKNFWRKN